SATRSDPFLQLDDLEAALPFWLAGRRGLPLATRLHGLVGLLRFHGNLLSSEQWSALSWTGPPPARKPSAGASSGRCGIRLAADTHRPCLSLNVELRRREAVSSPSRSIHCRRTLRLGD